MSEQLKKQVVCEYWSDPLCVWALASQSRLDSLIAEGGDRLSIRYRVVTVFGSVPWRFSQGPWAAEGPAGRAAATQKVGARFGLQLSGRAWLDDPPASSWSPGAAAAGVLLMEQQGECESGMGACYLRALREAFFLRDLNIARRHVQLQVAEQLDVARQPLAARLDDGRALAALWEDQMDKELHRIQGSPTYLFDGGRALLYGNFAEGILHATLAELLEGLQAGSSAC